MQMTDLFMGLCNQFWLMSCDGSHVIHLRASFMKAEQAAVTWLPYEKVYIQFDVFSLSHV